MIATSLSRPSQPACWKASHIEPSAISESPHRHHTRYGRRSSRAPVIATPTEIGSPWPSEPVATSVGGMRGVGWPSSREPSLRNVSSSASSITPIAFSTA